MRTCARCKREQAKEANVPGYHLKNLPTLNCVMRRTVFPHCINPFGVSSECHSKVIDMPLYCSTDVQRCIPDIEGLIDKESQSESGCAQELSPEGVEATKRLGKARTLLEQEIYCDRPNHFHCAGFPCFIKDCALPVPPNLTRMMRPRQSEDVKTLTHLSC